MRTPLYSVRKTSQLAREYSGQVFTDLNPDASYIRDDYHDVSISPRSYTEKNYYSDGLSRSVNALSGFAT